MKLLMAILIFGLIVFIHELGHFLFAKLSHIAVTEFSIGMGPRLFSFKPKETRYSIKLLPLGGSCMMVGEDEENDDVNAFGNKSVLARFSTVAAGPIFNFILAFVLALVVIGIAGVDKPDVYKVEKGSPADEVGMQKGEIITKVNGKSITISREFATYFQFSPVKSEKAIDITYKRNGKEQTVSIVPEEKEKYMLGFYYSQQQSGMKVTDVVEDSPFDQAGIKKNAIVTKINDVAISSAEDYEAYISEHPLDGTPIAVTYEEEGTQKVATITPQSQGKAYVIGLTVDTAREKVGVLDTLKYSLVEVKYWIVTTVESLKQLVTGRVKMNQVSGPVGIMNVIGNSYEQSKKDGVISVVVNMCYISILLSANLGVMNLLPLPALDGGRLVFLIVEGIRGKKIPRDKEGFVHFLGFVALMILMVIIMFHDIQMVFFK